MMATATAILETTQVRLLPMYPFSVVYGGLELQCVKTAEALKQNDVAAELLDYHNPNDEFDLLHLFGTTGNYFEICEQAVQKCRIVLSTVSGAPNASRVRPRIWKSVSRLAHFGRLQTTYDRLKAVCDAASAVLCLNRLEAKFMQVTYDVPPQRIKIVTNGVEDEYFEADGDDFTQRYGMKDFVLFTGNVTTRKNPLALARALNRLDVPGVFIGGVLNAEQEYAEAFSQLVSASPNLLWIPRLSHKDRLLASGYAAARVFCLPSSAETQSLSALEALAANTPVILGDFPYAYQTPFESCLKCNPRDETSLVHCLEQAMNEASTPAVRLSDRYRWRSVGAEIAGIYRQVLAENCC